MTLVYVALFISSSSSSGSLIGTLIQLAIIGLVIYCVLGACLGSRSYPNLYIWIHTFSNVSDYFKWGWGAGLGSSPLWFLSQLELTTESILGERPHSPTTCCMIMCYWWSLKMHLHIFANKDAPNTPNLSLIHIWRCRRRLRCRSRWSPYH